MKTPSIALTCLFFPILFTQILSSQNPVACDTAFLRNLGSPTKNEYSLGLYDSKDGNLYLTGITGGDSLTLLKMTPEGAFLWSKTINLNPGFMSGNSAEVAADLMVDNVGMIVCAGTMGNNSRGFLLRYDPVTETEIWSQSLLLTAHVHGLLQDPVDSNFLVYANNRDVFLTTNYGTQSSLVKHDKNTGIFVLQWPGSGIYLQTDTTSIDLIRSMVVYDGKLYGCGGFTIPGLGSAGRRHTIFRLDLNGNVEWSRMGPADADIAQNLAGQDLLIENDHIISLFSGNDAGSDSTNSTTFLQKSTLEGDVVWVKKYDLGAPFTYEVASEVVSVPDGFVILGHQGNGNEGLFFIKTDKNGALIWSKKLDAGGSFLADSGIPQSQLIYLNGGLFFAAATKDASGKSDMMFGRMCPDGQLGMSCDYLSNLDVAESTLVNPVSISGNLLRKIGGQSVSTFNNNSGFKPVPFQTSLVCSGSYTLCDTVRLSEILTFCPGTAITIAGQTYTQPGVVLDTIPGIGGDCDTVVTHTLQYATPAPSTITIQCPGSITVISGPGNAPTPIQYTPPTAITNCLCPGTMTALSSGLPSGAAFPNGITKVCYQAKDSCGQTASCCFNVTVREEQACDEKINGCIKYELLEITADAAKNLTYRIKVTNNCANKLIYTAIQVPTGLVAIEPANNSIFESASGHEYLVRSPNFTPFYSIRFKSTTDSISNGQSDVFVYTLPAQTAPVFINITSRLAPQLFYEAHLNTFNCPIGITSNGNIQQDRDASVLHQEKKLRLSPNPTTGLLVLDISAWKEDWTQLEIMDSRGCLVWNNRVKAGIDPVSIQLPEDLSNGLYYFSIKPDQDKKQGTRFLLIR